MIRSSVLRLIFNTYKVIYGGSWRFVVFDRFAAISAPKNGEGYQRSDAGTAGDSPTSTAPFLRSCQGTEGMSLSSRRTLDPELLHEIGTIGIPIIDLGAFLERLRAQGRDPYYWPVTKMPVTGIMSPSPL